jgi:hypothetical protein
MTLKSENQKKLKMNQTMNGSGWGDLTIPDRYCTGSENGHEIQQGELSSLAGVPKREYPHVQRKSGLRSRQELVTREIPDGTG